MIDASRRGSAPLILAVAAGLLALGMTGCAGQGVPGSGQSSSPPASGQPSPPTTSVPGTPPATGQPGSAPVRDYPGGPRGLGYPSGSVGVAYATWLENGDQFAITMYGSSSCAPTGTGFAVTGPNTLQIFVKGVPQHVMCTDDIAPHTTVFATPQAVDRSRALTLLVKTNTITLPALAG